LRPRALRPQLKRDPLGSGTVMTSMNNTEPPLRGWLLVFALQYALGLVLNCFYGARSGYRAWSLLGGTTDFARHLGRYVAGRAATEIAIAVIIGVGLIMLVRGKQAAPRYWPVALLLLLALETAAVVCRYAESRFLIEAGRTSNFALSRFAVGLPLALGITVAWVLYWHRSSRVRRTFMGSSPDAAA